MFTLWIQKNKTEDELTYEQHGRVNHLIWRMHWRIADAEDHRDGTLDYDEESSYADKDPHKYPWR